MDHKHNQTDGINRNNNKRIALVVFLGGLFVLTYLIIASIIDGWRICGPGNIDYAVTGQFGDFIGGVIGTIINAAAFYFLYLTLNDQRKSSDDQRKSSDNQQKSFERERFETRFFEMINLHRKNVEELNYTTKYLKNRVKVEVTSVARKVFKLIDADFVLLYQELSFFFENQTSKNIYSQDYIDKVGENPNLKEFERDIDLVEYAQIDITYSILFLGLGSQDRKALINLFRKRYKEEFFTSIIAFAALKPKKESRYYKIWDSFISQANPKQQFIKAIESENMKDVLSRNGHNALAKKIFNEKTTIIAENEEKRFDRYYGGHQFRLGHYFRHLFQAVNYINNNTNLDYEQKYENVKLLRAQLSTFEQRLIFINSISSFGRIWELEIVGDATKKIILDDGLITKYNFIKNIPHGEMIDGKISVNRYYPMVTLEMNYDDDAKKKREELEKKYR